MRYTNPSTGNLSWQKTWFFCESGIVHVMINILYSKSSAPVYSVLDQKRLSGPTFVNGNQSTATNITTPQTLWHNAVGYSFPGTTNTTLHIRQGARNSTWSSIGTSASPQTSVDMWAAWLEHRNTTEPFEYSIFPGIEQPNLEGQSRDAPIRSMVNNRNVSAIFDTRGSRVSIVFWQKDGGSAVVNTSPTLAPLNVTSPAGMVLMLSLQDGVVTASDPSQSLTNATVDFAFGAGGLPPFWSWSERRRSMNITFAKGGMAGSSVSGRL